MKNELEELNKEYRKKWEISSSVEYTWWENYGDKAFNLGKKEAIKIIDELENPYPEDIFLKLELSKFQTDEINYILKTKFGFTLDRLSAHIMRIARNNLINELKQKIEEKK